MLAIKSWEKQKALINSLISIITRLFSSGESLDDVWRIWNHSAPTKHNEVLESMAGITQSSVCAIHFNHKLRIFHKLTWSQISFLIKRLWIFFHGIFYSVRQLSLERSTWYVMLTNHVWEWHAMFGYLFYFIFKRAQFRMYLLKEKNVCLYVLLLCFGRTFCSFFHLYIHFGENDIASPSTLLVPDQLLMNVLNK